MNKTAYLCLFLGAMTSLCWAGDVVLPKNMGAFCAGKSAQFLGVLARALEQHRPAKGRSDAVFSQWSRKNPLEKVIEKTSLQKWIHSQVTSLSKKAKQNFKTKINEDELASYGFAGLIKAYYSFTASNAKGTFVNYARKEITAAIVESIQTLWRTQNPRAEILRGSSVMKFAKYHSEKFPPTGNAVKDRQIFEERLSDAHYILVRAYETFDPTRNATWHTHATNAIKSTVIQDGRKMEWLIHKYIRRIKQNHQILDPWEDLSTFLKSMKEQRKKDILAWHAKRKGRSLTQEEINQLPFMSSDTYKDAVLDLTLPKLEKYIINGETEVRRLTDQPLDGIVVNRFGLTEGAGSVLGDQLSSADAKKFVDLVQDFFETVERKGNGTRNIGVFTSTFLLDRPLSRKEIMATYKVRKSMISNINREMLADLRAYITARLKAEP